MKDSPPIRMTESYKNAKGELMHALAGLVDLKAREICRERDTCVITKAMLDEAFDNAIRDSHDVEERLRAIKDIIDSVETRCLAADGPVTPTLKEMGEDELRKIYRLAGGKVKHMGLETPRSYGQSVGGCACGAGRVCFQHAKGG